MFGVEAPITCGGMTRVGKVELIAAVANAGALGFITAHSAGRPEDLAKAVSRCREFTDKPFGVNLTILPSITPLPYDEYSEAIIASGVKIVEPVFQFTDENSYGVVDRNRWRPADRHRPVGRF